MILQSSYIKVTLLSLCLFHFCLLAETDKPILSVGVSPCVTDFKPLEFLRYLKRNTSNTVFLEKQVNDWIKEENLKELIPLISPLISNDEPCSGVSLQISSFLSKELSTISNEACFMIEGYIKGIYPPEISSHRAKSERKERVLKWIAVEYPESEFSMQYDKTLINRERKHWYENLHGLYKTGYVPAAVELGNRLYKHGRGKPEDYEKALEVYHFAAHSGDEVAQFYYARMHQYGHGCEQDFDVAFEWYQKAAQNGERRAWNNLGYMFDNGQGREIDAEKAFNYYKKASDAGMAMGSYNIAQKYRQNDDKNKKNLKKAVHYYELALKQSENRYASAANHLGRIYSKGGYGIEKDERKALEYYWLGTRYSDEHAPYNLGKFYKKRFGQEGSLEVAIYCFHLSAERGYSNAWNQLGYLYEDEAYGVKDLEKALSFYKLAAKRGSVRGIKNYISGLEKNKPEKAFEFLHSHMDYREPSLLFSLGWYYAKGIGVEKNEAKAFSIYKNAAEMGYAKAMSEVGWWYESGRYTEQDIEKAIHWYEKAIAMNDPIALNNLGCLHAFRKIENADVSYGIELLERAAEEGENRAVNNLIDLYSQGTGDIPVDEEKANYWRNFKEDM